MNASEFRWMTPLFDRRRNSKSSFTYTTAPMIINVKISINKEKNVEKAINTDHTNNRSRNTSKTRCHFIVYIKRTSSFDDASVS